MLIRIKKGADGSAALTCVRADGTVTWQRQRGRQASFFPRHDLTHYAVEMVLGHRRGFYGLIADGWALTDFGTPWPRGPMPADSDPAELIVGFLDLERAAGVTWGAEDFNARAAEYRAAHGEFGPCELTDADLARVRTVMRALFDRWAALPPGEILELVFEVSAAAS